jgi:hypothetical protein
MLEQAWATIANNSIFVASITVAFFTIKGLLWLAIPYMVIRWRGYATRRNRNEVVKSEQASI